MRTAMFLSALIISCQPLYAQKGILMGKITDEHNAPIKNAELIAVKDVLDYTAVVTDGGLYYTDSIFTGDYNVYIIVNKVTYQSKVKVVPPGKKPTFFNFKVGHDKAVVSVVDYDPFMEKTLNKVRKEAATINY